MRRETAPAKYLPLAQAWNIKEQGARDQVNLAHTTFQSLERWALGDEVDQGLGTWCMLITLKIWYASLSMHPRVLMLIQKKLLYSALKPGPHRQRIGVTA